MKIRFFHNFIETLISKISLFIENHPKFYNLLYNYFDRSTNLTAKTLFDFRISLPLFFLLYAFPIFYYPEMGEYQLYIGGGGSVLKGFFIYIPLPLKIVLITYFTLLALVTINTLLTFIPCIVKRLK